MNRTDPCKQTDNELIPETSVGMLRRRLAVLGLAIALVCLYPSPTLSKNQKKKLVESSDGCKACKRMVMSLEKAVFPRLEQAVCTNCHPP